MGKTLTRADLIDALGREVGLSRNDCSDLLESMLEHLAKTLEKGQLVKLARFGAGWSVSRLPRSCGNGLKKADEIGGGH